MLAIGKYLLILALMACVSAPSALAWEVSPSVTGPWQRSPCS